MQALKFVLAVAWIVLSGLLHADTVVDSGRVISVVSEAWPPYISIESGKARGLEVEIAEEAFQLMAMRMEFEELPWQRALLRVQEQRADAILGIFQNADRQSYLYFPDEPLLETSYAVFSNQSKPVNYNGISDLSGLNVAVTRGYFYSQEFSDATAIKKVEVTGVEQSLGMLALGRVDVVIDNRAVGLYFSNKMGINSKIYVSEKPLTPPNPHYIAFSMKAENKKLCEEFSLSLARFRKTDAYTELLKKYGY